MLIVDCLYAAADYGHSEYGCRTHGFDGHGRLRIGLSKRAQTEGGCDCEQQLYFHNISLKQMAAALLSILCWYAPASLASRDVKFHDPT
jgi:hypothetical protein